MADNKTPDACPVDHRAREAWLSQARAAQTTSPSQSPAATPQTCPVDHHSHNQNQKSWGATLSSYLPWSSSPSSSSSSSSSAKPSTPPHHHHHQPSQPQQQLDNDRVISSIPRSHANPSACPVDHGSSANAETSDSAADAATGNWVYPSERMFFDAMRRKGHDARPSDMRTVVPIHNAVNERAWAQIKAWEAPYLEGTQCGGPKLESFANKMDRMTPTARLNTILGYSAPFDRHDWVVDRCGTRVDYVIDFYSGRAPGGGNGGNGGGAAGPSFYLDVRPKLNTWEGAKMRAYRWVGLA